MTESAEIPNSDSELLPIDPETKESLNAVLEQFNTVLEQIELIESDPEIKKSEDDLSLSISFVRSICLEQKSDIQQMIDDENRGDQDSNKLLVSKVELKILFPRFFEAVQAIRARLDIKVGARSSSVNQLKGKTEALAVALEKIDLETEKALAHIG